MMTSAENDLSLKSKIKEHVCYVVDLCGGNLTEACKILGISYRTLTNWRRRWGIRSRLKYGNEKYKALRF